MINLITVVIHLNILWRLCPRLVLATDIELEIRDDQRDFCPQGFQSCWNKSKINLKIYNRVIWDQLAI